MSGTRTNFAPAKAKKPSYFWRTSSPRSKSSCRTPRRRSTTTGGAKASRKGIIPGLISLDGKNAVVLDRLADLSRDLTNAEVNRIGLEAQVAIIRKHDYDSLPAVAQS